MTTAYLGFLFITFTFLINCGIGLRKLPVCPCKNTALCRTHLFQPKTEIAIVAEGKSNYINWPWKNISTVIADNFTDPQLMCKAHQNGANYAFVEKVPLITNTSDPAFSEWINNVVEKSRLLYADFIALDFLELTNQCHKSDLHIEDVSNAVDAISRRLHIGGSKVICIMPWKPPCYDGDCSLIKNMEILCTTFITSPKSFISSCDLNCVARATVPMSSQVLGLNEYLTHNIQASKLMIGIPWHGYDYRCQNLVPKENSHDVCTLHTIEKDNRTVCDYSREKLTLGRLANKYPQNIANVHKFSKIYRAPYFSYLDKTEGNGTEHQIWYESFDSLLDKYLLAKDLQLKGLVIWSGDDLSDNENVVQSEWNWMMHALFSTGNVKMEEPHDFAGMAAAIASGCLILGAIIGFSVACVITRTQMKRRRLHTPFQKDDDDDDLDYHDEDQNL